MTKNCCGTVIEFVWENRPLKSKVFVVMGNQLLKDVARFVEVRRTYGPPGIPFVPLRTSSPPGRVANHVPNVSYKTSKGCHGDSAFL
jgi:hypothetical protein